jgi:hypothetical protein
MQTVVATLKQLVLTQMHALDNVATIVEDTSYVLRVDSTREMRVAVVPVISGSCCYFLHKKA